MDGLGCHHQGPLLARPMDQRGRITYTRVGDLFTHHKNRDRSEYFTLCQDGKKRRGIGCVCYFPGVFLFWCVNKCNASCFEAFAFPYSHASASQRLQRLELYFNFQGVPPESKRVAFLVCFFMKRSRFLTIANKEGSKEVRNNDELHFSWLFVM